MRTRVFICAVIFLLLTAVKVYYPATAQKMREYILPQMSGTDLRSEVIAIGRQLTGNGGVFYALRKEEDEGVKADTEDEAPDVSAAFDIDKMVSQNLAGFAFANIDSAADGGQSGAADIPQRFGSAVEAPSDPTTAPSVSESAVPEKSEKEQKREAFLEIQADFSDYAIPAGVSYDIPSIPFECVCPASAAVSSVFGYRLHPVYNDVRFHYGTDFALCDGEDVSAFADGTVVSADEISGYGLTVVISHADGFTTLYGHLSKSLVKAGDAVKKGQTIALSGHSGTTSGPNLHFEVECDGVRYNPELCY